jgi:hypothetical protein
MLRAVPWKRGAAEGAGDGEVLVALTDFRVHRWRDVPGVWMSGLRLRQRWPSTDGAIALQFWVEPLRRRSGSVSVWTSEDALRGFLRTQAHRAVATRYRDKAGLWTDKFRAERFDRDAVWAEAERRLAEASEPVSATAAR